MRSTPWKILVIGSVHLLDLLQDRWIALVNAVAFGTPIVPFHEFTLAIEVA
jgi:hypothetical protein